MATNADARNCSAMIDTDYRRALWLGFFAITAWGGTPIATKLAVASLSPLAVTFWRTLGAAVGYLAAFSSFGAYVAWYAALAGRPAISQIQFLQGAIGVLLAVALLGEWLECRVLGVAVLILTGVVATQKAVRTAAPPASNSNRGVAS